MNRRSKGEHLERLNGKILYPSRSMSYAKRHNSRVLDLGGNVQQALFHIDPPKPLRDKP